jgi:hypothetical protein
LSFAAGIPFDREATEGERQGMTLFSAVPGKQFAYNGLSMESFLAKSARTEHAPLSRPFLSKTLET